MEKYRFDSATHSMLDKLCVPFAVYQLVDKRVETILLSDGFCDLFGFEKKDEAYYVMENDMWRLTHPRIKPELQTKLTVLPLREVSLRSYTAPLPETVPII